MKRQIDIPITKEDLQFILQSDFEKIVDLAKYNSFCPRCTGDKEVEMLNYEICLNSINNVIFIVECSSCKEGIARQVEIGEQPKYRLKTEIIKGQKMSKN